MKHTNHSSSPSITNLLRDATRATAELAVSPCANLHQTVGTLVRIGCQALGAKESRTRTSLLTFIRETLAAIRFCIVSLPATFGVRDLVQINAYLRAAA